METGITQLLMITLFQLLLSVCGLDILCGEFVHLILLEEIILSYLDIPITFIISY